MLLLAKYYSMRNDNERTLIFCAFAGEEIQMLGSKFFVNQIKSGTGIRIKAEPHENNNLFLRSDNYPFAERGIPAHTVMCSDNLEPCYHKPCDDVSRIDFTNMTEVIKAIIQGSSSIINGQDTPSRLIRPARIKF